MNRNFIDQLSEDEKSAITTLVAGGFLSLADVKIRDCRDLASGKRYRTFRNRGKYDLVLACRNLAGRQLPEPAPAADPAPNEQPATGPVLLKPVSDMLKEELLAEARTYPAITGENRMNKAELAEVVQARRDRKELLFKKFEV